MKPRKGQEFQTVIEQRVVHVGDDYVVVEDLETGVKTTVDLNKAGELENYELISHGSEAAESSEVAPDQRRMPWGSVRGPHVVMDAESASAFAFNLDWLKRNPDKTLPSNQSGVFCLAQREYAKKRGWKKGMIVKAQGEG